MKPIKIQIVGGVATITLNCPERKNALSVGMRQALDATLPELRQDPSVKAVIITGEGDAFCSGGDISSISTASKRDGRRAMRDIQLTWEELAGFDKPVIAAVHGPAYGAGFSLAMAADFILASDRARFCLSFARIGLVPDLGVLHTLPRAIGMQRARELLYFGREVGPDEAAELGLVLEVLPPEELLGRAHELASALGQSSPSAFAITKQILSRSFETDRQALLESEATAQALCFGTDYLAESIQRYQRREQPLLKWPIRKV